MPTVKVGAIRWPWRYAYSDSTDPVVQERTGKTAVHRALEHPRWQWRAPADSTVLALHKLLIPSDQAAMGREIAAAVAGNLSFWLWLRYPTDPVNDGFNRGLALYQAAAAKASLPWASLEGVQTLGNASAYAAQITRLVAEMGQAHYFKVLANRPYVGLYGDAGSFATNWGTLANFRTAIDALRTQAQAAGLGDPYVVGYFGADAATATALGVDAVSNYIGNVPDHYNPAYSELASRTEAYWATLAGAAAKIVPVCMAGWHRGPRQERPDWSNGARTSAGAYRSYGWRPFMAASLNVAEPTQAELAAHVQAAVAYVNANPARCDAQVVSMYAWDENSESTPLCPILGNPSGKIGWLASTLANA